MVETVIGWFENVTWTRYFYAVLIILSIYCPLERNINTDNVYRLLGFMLIAIGATVAIVGQENATVWWGIILVLITYIYEFIDKAKERQPKYDRRAK